MTIQAVNIPAWARHAVFYEVYPQSFFDSNGDGIGDLEGVRLKLPYIASTGATAIWLNPFYPSPMRDAGYDIADFRQVDPRYGTLDDACRLFVEARAVGLRILLDLVPGHTSIDHPWFRESSKRHPARPFKNWFIWTESAWDNGGPPWNAKMIHGYSQRDGNFLVNFFWSQPALNFGFAQPDPNQPWQLHTTHPDVQALWSEMRAIMRFWLGLGIDGFRVDMADSIIRSDPGKTETRRFWRETREELSRDFPELFLIAEGHPCNLLDGTGFHSAFLHWAPGYPEVFRSGEAFNQELGKVRTRAFFDRSGTGDFRPYLKTWREQYRKTRHGGVITMPVGNHDLSRVAGGQSEDDLEMVFAFQAAWPGIPFIYYGDEIGLRQQSSDNPIHEGHYPDRNGARTPMHWDNSVNCGFSECVPNQLYLPVDPAPGESTVAAQEGRPNSLLHRVRRLTLLHRETPALAADAAIEILRDGAPGQPLVFTRSGNGQTLLCAFHPAAAPVEIALPLPPSATLHLLACSPLAPTIVASRLRFSGSTWAIWDFQGGDLALAETRGSQMDETGL
jgi:glycosidase